MSDKKAIVMPIKAAQKTEQKMVSVLRLCKWFPGELEEIFQHRPQFLKLLRREGLIPEPIPESGGETC